ncbi:hypothetical protein, partial [Mycobacterium tuberculosis]
MTSSHLIDAEQLLADQLVDAPQDVSAWLRSAVIPPLVG